MKVVFHPAAEADFEDLIDFIVGRAGARIAQGQADKALASLSTIGDYPRTSKYDADLDVFEAWLPGTRYIAFYRIRQDLDSVIVLAIIDHARNTAGTKRRLITVRG